MSEYDYNDFSSPGSDLNHDGKVDFAEYDNDCHDFDNIYGKNKGGKGAPSRYSGLLHRIKWLNSSDLVLMGLISLAFPPFLIVSAIIVIIGLFLNF